DFAGVVIGSELAAVLFAEPAGLATDLGQAVSADLAMVRPGLAELARLGSTEPATMDASRALDAVLDIEKQQAWLEAQKQRLLAQLGTRDPSAKKWCVEEVGAALRLSGPRARTKLAHAEQLVNWLPATLAALADGRLTPAQVGVIVRFSFQLPDELLPGFERRVLAHAEEQSVSNLARTAQRAVLCLNPLSAEQKHQQAKQDRQVRITPAEHGMAWLMALLPAADAKAVYARLDGAARMAPGLDPRSMDQLRADALVNGVLTGIGGGLPTEQGRQPGITVTVSLDTLVGASEQPGWLDGYGPISAGYARELAHDPTGTWRRLVTDPVTGQLLDYGVTRYRPPRRLADHVIERDGECTFPYCGHSARRSDLDHIIPFPQGRTAVSNLQPLHRRHHNAKTEAGWHAERDPATGATRWTSPQGRRYQTRPPARWPRPDHAAPF
ncbi:MAG TPA: DUF222 domain-containing protein, partial [Jatrophihabitans sp.]|nr:DUF222 domain-containing protein [Jatrophihabitans sp.]